MVEADQMAGSPAYDFPNLCRGKHVLVLGGTGFIGQAVVRLLIENQAEVTMLVRSDTSDAPPGVRILMGDLRSLNWGTLVSGTGQMPDAIIHLARIPGRRRFSRWLAGLQGRAASRRLLHWLGTLTAPPHTVYVSGTLVYGDRGTTPTDETAPLNPIAFQRDYVQAEHPFLQKMGFEAGQEEPYLADEHVFQFLSGFEPDQEEPIRSVSQSRTTANPGLNQGYQTGAISRMFSGLNWFQIGNTKNNRVATTRKLPLSIVRPPWVLGSGSWFQQFYLNTASKSGKVPLFGDGSNLMSLIHVDDCAAQIISVALGGTPGKTYNLCAMPPVTQQEFVTELCRLTGASTYPVPADAVRRKYGHTLSEALLFSLHSVSGHDLIQHFPNRFGNLHQAMADIVSAQHQA
jgi:nucleoside-diphosphate-sugar epimerase